MSDFTNTLQESISELQNNHDDNEYAHIDEDEIHIEVLRAIANGEPNASELAKIALTTLDIDFERWYA